MFWILCVYPFPNLIGGEAGRLFLIYMYLHLLNFNLGLFSLSSGISRVGLAGVSLIACFSGFGSIAFPATHIKWFMKKVSADELRNMERQLERTMGSIALKKKELLVQKSDEDQSNFFQRFVSRISNKDVVVSLRSEIQGLEFFADTQFTEYCEFKRERERIESSNTTRGKIYNIAGYFFSVYCAYKFITSLVNITFGRRNQEDPITMALKIVNLNIDISFWTQVISLLLIGIMISLTVRGLLKKIFKLFSEWSAVISSVNVALFLAQLMGMYFISTILLLRANLPEAYR